MADAKKCDICGSFFSLDYTGTERPSTYGNYIDGIKLMDFKHQQNLGCYDLCEICTRDLLAFIKQHNKKEAPNE